MRIIRILMVLMILLPLGARAQRADIIVTRDGNKYEGYLIKQVPNKSVTIESEKTTITVASKDAQLSRLRDRMVGDLPEEAAALFPLLSDDAPVEIADVTVEEFDGKKVVYKRAVLLEKGVYYKFVSFEPKTVEIGWSQIKTSSKYPYDFTKAVGFRDHLILPNADILVGQLIEQDLRSGIFTFRGVNGQVTNYHKSGLQAVRFVPIDSDANVWELIPFCDKVNLKDGTSRDGFIISKVFGKTVELRHYNSTLSETIPIRDIESYEKYKNPLFKQTFEVPEVVEHYADLYVNGETRHVCKLQRQKKSFYVSNEIDSLQTRVNAGERVVIKYRAEARTSRFCVAKAKLVEENIYRMSGLKVNNKGKEYHPVFSTSDIIDNPDINFQANEGGYITADFVPDSPGVFVFFINGSERCFVIYAQ